MATNYLTLCCIFLKFQFKIKALQYNLVLYHSSASATHPFNRWQKHKNIFQWNRHKVIVSDLENHCRVFLLIQFNRMKNSQRIELKQVNEIQKLKLIFRMIKFIILVFEEKLGHYRDWFSWHLIYYDPLDVRKVNPVVKWLLLCSQLNLNLLSTLNSY